MRIGVLEVGAPPPQLQPRFGGYGQMFAGLLGGHGVDLQTLAVTSGQWPARIEDYDAYLVTGSAAGVYDDLPWIAPLKTFLTQARGRARLVGVCFGHQVMAEAFGGQVIKSPRGWGVGLHTYEVQAAQPWMDVTPAFRIPASHQDQVVALPPGVQVVASSDFTPFAALAYGAEAISFQGHPEFQPDYAKALLESRRGARLSHAATDAAQASLDAPGDGPRVGGWIRRFLAAA